MITKGAMMKTIKYLLPLLFISTSVYAGKLQNSDFATAAQITGAGGTLDQLLNDTKVWSTVLNEQISTALTNGDLANKTKPFNWGQFATPANPAAGFDKLYFKADDKLYGLNSAGAEVLIGPSIGASPLTTKGDLYTYSVVDTRLPVGTDGQILSADSAQVTGLKWIANTPAGAWLLVGNAGTVPGVNFLGTTDAQDFIIKTNSTTRSQYFSTGEITSSMTYVVPADGTPGTQKDYIFESEFDAANNNTDRSLYHIAFDSHVDRSHSGNDISNVTAVSDAASVEGAGVITNHSAMSINHNFLGDTGGTTTNGSSLGISASAAAAYNLDNYSAITANFTGDPASVVGNYTGLTVGSGSVLTGNYVGSNVNETGAIGGTYQGSIISETGAVVGNASSVGISQAGNVTGNYSGLSINKTGNSAAFSGLSIVHAAGNSTSAEGYRIDLGPGTATSKVGMTALMGDGVTANSGRILDGSWNDGDYNDRIGVQINGGTGDITTNDIGLNVGQSAGTSATFQGINVSAGGTTNAWTGIEVGGTGASTGNVFGIKSDVTNVSSPSQKVAISLSGGAIVAGSPYDTSVLPASPGFINLQQIGGTFTVANGFPVTTTLAFGVNLGANAFFNDSMGPDPTGIIGFSNVGYVGQVSVAAGKTASLLNMSVAGSGVLPGGGTVGEVNMYQAAGFLGNPADLTVNRMTAFSAPSGLCTYGSDCWGVKISDVAASNSFARNVVVGAAFTFNNSVGIELNSTTKAILNARLSTGQRNALVATNGMQIYNTTSNQLECYQGGSWVACGGSGGGSSGQNVPRFVLSGGVGGPIDEFDGQHTSTVSETYSKVSFSAANSGGVGYSNNIQVMRTNSSGLFQESQTITVNATGARMSSTVTLPSPIVTNPGDIIWANLISVPASGNPHDYTVEFKF